VADGDEDVRVGALRAALQARDPGDVESLIEAARVDPSPVARTVAIRGLGVLGGERAVLALHDLWPRAEDQKPAIAAAWAMPASLAAGGARELSLVAGRETGAPAIAAALALQTLGGDEAKIALGVLLRAVKLGPTKDRVLAIGSIPAADPDALAALQSAAADPDEVVAIVATYRLANLLAGSSPPKGVDRNDLVAKLEKIASGGGTNGYQAKLALARMGHRRVTTMLAADADAEDEQARASASRAYAQLGELGRAALALSDKSPSVRAIAVCAVLRAH
jgi:hypothetical protein